ncbi:hydrolase [Streptomyces lydicus]|nr:hydrolase [Streptomyces lydicus]MCZ1008163.1 hydrolase [Streptomyces lydicus]
MTLPAPTGRYQVGTVALRLTQWTRADPWTGRRTRRELMVSIRYPARAGAGRYPTAPQLSAREAAAFDVRNNFSEQVPRGKVRWAATRTSAHVGAPPAAGRAPGQRLPVVLYSPGVGDPRSFGSTLCDELASRGYAVVTIDHTYEAPAVEFPDGRLARSVLASELAKAQKSGRITELLKKVSGVRVADTRFVLDELAERGAASPLPSGLRRALDLHAVGMFGQSAGGFTAAQTMHDDRRIKAAVNLDGVMGYTQRDDDPSNPSTVGREGVDRPLLLMGMAGNTHHTVASWGAVWRHSTGTWLRDLTLRGSRHASFTDAEALVPQIARRVGLPRKEVTALIGTVDPARAVAAQRAYVSAFFDRWLRGRDDGGLLDGPSARFPEVQFVR